MRTTTCNKFAIELLNLDAYTVLIHEMMLNKSFNPGQLFEFTSEVANCNNTNLSDITSWDYQLFFNTVFNAYTKYYKQAA